MYKKVKRALVCLFLALLVYLITIEVARECGAGYTATTDGPGFYGILVKNSEQGQAYFSNDVCFVELNALSNINRSSTVVLSPSELRTIYRDAGYTPGTNLFPHLPRPPTSSRMAAIAKEWNCFRKETSGGRSPLIMYNDRYIRLVASWGEMTYAPAHAHDLIYSVDSVSNTLQVHRDIKWEFTGSWLPLYRSREKPSRASCMSNLSQIGRACVMYSMDHNDALPTSFSQLQTAEAPPKVFVCPLSKHKPGNLSEVDQWTDYVLVTNQTAASPAETIVAYCKPENHKGNGCNILLNDGSVIWSKTEDFSNLTVNVKAHSRINEEKPEPKL